MTCSPAIAANAPPLSWLNFPWARLFPFLCVLLLVALLPTASCTSVSARKKKQASAEAAEREQQPPTPIVVGKIVLVDEENSFVLIDSGNFQALAAGTKLTTIAGDGEESAALLVSSVQRRPFTVADFASGVPQKGQTVVKE
jgi:hypothetical protein